MGRPIPVLTPQEAFIIARHTKQLLRDEVPEKGVRSSLKELSEVQALGGVAARVLLMEQASKVTIIFGHENEEERVRMSTLEIIPEAPAFGRLIEGIQPEEFGSLVLADLMALEAQAEEEG